MGLWRSLKEKFEIRVSRIQGGKGKDLLFVAE